MELAINTAQLPIWLDVEDARKIVPYSKLKELRENRKVRMTTNQGKQVYNLEDLLYNRGVKSLIYMAEKDLIEVEETKKELISGELEMTGPSIEEIKSICQPKEVKGFKVEKEESVIETNKSIGTSSRSYQDKKFIYTKLFAKPFEAKFPGMVTPAFSVRYPKEDIKLSYEIGGIIRDIQMYKAELRDGQQVTKTQIIIEESDNVFFIIQMNLFYEETILFEMILDTICDDVSSVDKPMSIRCFRENESNAYEVSLGDVTYDWAKPSGFMPKTSDLVIIQKWTRSVHILQQYKQVKTVHKATSDKEFKEYIKLIS